MFSIIFAAAVLLNHTYVSEYGAVYAATSIIYPIIMTSINHHLKLLAGIELVQEIFLIVVISPHRAVLEVAFLYYLVATYSVLAILIVRTMWKISPEVVDYVGEDLV